MVGRAAGAVTTGAGASDRPVSIAETVLLAGEQVTHLERRADPGCAHDLGRVLLTEHGEEFVGIRDAVLAGEGPHLTAHVGVADRTAHVCLSRTPDGLRHTAGHVLADGPVGAGGTVDHAEDDRVGLPVGGVEQLGDDAFLVGCADGGDAESGVVLGQVDDLAVHGSCGRVDGVLGVGTQHVCELEGACLRP